MGSLLLLSPIIRNTLPSFKLGQIKSCPCFGLVIHNILNKRVDSTVKNFEGKGTIVRSLLGGVEGLNVTVVNHLECVLIFYFLDQIGKLFNSCVPLFRNLAAFLLAENVLEVLKNFKKCLENIFGIEKSNMFVTLFK
jgi:hypothetical protein